MATESVLQAVQHYQRSIEKNSGDVARLLHCVGKLYKLPITVGHLQETGVGRTVNALRKHNGELGVAAEAVVNKWKEIVASENDSRANEQSSSEDEQEDDADNNAADDNDDDDEDDDDERNQRAKNTPPKTEQKPEKSNDKQTKETNSHSSSKSSHERHERRHKSEHKEKEQRSSSKEKQQKHHRSKHEDHSSSRNGDKEKREKNDSSSNYKRRRDEEKNRSSNGHDSKEDKESKRHKHKSSSSREDDKKTQNDSSNRQHQHKSSGSSSSGKHKSHDKQHDDKEKEKDKDKSHKSKSHSSAHKKSASTDATSPPVCSASAEDRHAKNAATAASTSKRRIEDTNSSEQSPKKLKTQNTQHESKRSGSNKQQLSNNDDDGIDSSMGANFADVLGMLNMPQKKAKKSLSALKQTSPSTPTSSSSSTKKSAALAAEHSVSEKSVTVSSKLKNERCADGPSTSTQLNLEKKPSLLNSNVKLAPLDPSIALELPVISNNYKPLPLNPTVMDCVFNSSTSSSSRAPPRLFSEAEALSHGISSKTIRTKVYSGVKSGQLFQVPSLFDLCIRILQKNIDALEYTGGVPFDVLKPVLERATPQQLFTFEEYNPYLMEDSDVLWQQHVQRTYRGQKRQELESWREMFMRCQEEQERRLSMLAQNIKQSQKVMAEPVRKTQLAFVDSMVKPPRNVMRKQEQYGTKSKLVATPAARVAALSSVTPNAAKTGDVRLRTAAAVRFDPAQVAAAPSKPKKAPLMAKTLQFMRGRHRR